LDNGLNNVGSKIGKPQKPANMRVAEAKALRNFGGVGVFALS
jgi:hypothetical protein